MSVMGRRAAPRVKAGALEPASIAAAGVSPLSSEPPKRAENLIILDKSDNIMGTRKITVKPNLSEWAYGRALKSRHGETMPPGAYQIDHHEVLTFLQRALADRIAVQALEWLDAKRTQIPGAKGPSVFFMAFSAVPRYVGKADLPWSSEELERAETLRKSWTPHHWSCDQAARTLLLLSLPVEDRERYLKTLNQLFQAADCAELVALYQSLPLMAYPEQHVLRAAEGIRSNMTTVFDAVALRNPYPCDHLKEEAWNQLILKAVFIGSPLHPIMGLDQRSNPELARMLIDYAHERWAAGRTVTPEIWRLIGPHADAPMLEDLSRILTDAQPQLQEAAALALSQCSLPQARTRLESQPILLSAIDEGSLSWEAFNEKWLIDQVP